MFRKELVLAAIVAVFSFCCQAEAAQIAVSWDGGGNYNDWDDANNWDPNIVPDNDANTYAVTINAGTGEVHVGLRQRSTIDQLDCYGEVDLVMGPHDWQNEPVELTLVEPNGLTNHGYLEIDEIEINGDITNSAGANLELCDMEISGNVTNTNEAELELGGVDIDGDLYNLPDATIEVEFENDAEGDLQNEGTITIISASDLLCDNELHNTGLINIYDGECGVDTILDNNSTGIMQGFGVIYAGQQLRNKGQIIAFGGSLAVAIDGTLINTGVLGNSPLSSLHIKPAEDVNNNGTIEVNSGGGVVFDCNLVNEPNGIIELLGGTLAATMITQKAGATFEGFGTITGNVIIEPNSVTEPNSVIRLTGPTNIVGDVTIDPNATLQISDGQTLITGHTTCKGTIHLIGGTVIFQGGCDCDECNIISEPGDDRNHFDINADGIEDFKDFAYFADSWLWQATWY